MDDQSQETFVNTPPTVASSESIQWRRRRWWLMGLPLWAGAACLPGAVALGALARAMPETTESVYGRTLYPWIGGSLARLTGLVAPLSIAEVVACAVIVFLIVWMGVTLITRRERGLPLMKLRRGWWKRGPARAIAFIGMAAIWFQLLWGLNYQRPGVAEQAGLAQAIRDHPIDREELISALHIIIAEAERLRDESGFRSDEYYKLPPDALTRSAPGWDTVAAQHPGISPYGSPPKTPFLWPVMEKLGISGIYWPFTGEAHVNSGIPNVLKPFTAAHEQAHQRGIAGEDEANWLGWRVCVESGDPLAAYSGHFAAILYLTSALRSVDPEAAEWVLGEHSLQRGFSLRRLPEMEPEERRAWFDLVQEHQPTLKKFYHLPQLHHYVHSDLLAVRAWQRRNAGPVREISKSVNNVYLKANAQEGVISYNRMVELVIADLRKQHNVDRLPPYRLQSLTDE